MSVCSVRFAEMCLCVCVCVCVRACVCVVVVDEKYRIFIFSFNLCHLIKRYNVYSLCFNNYNV